MGDVPANDDGSYEILPGARFFKEGQKGPAGLDAESIEAVLTISLTTCYRLHKMLGNPIEKTKIINQDTLDRYIDMVRSVCHGMIDPEKLHNIHGDGTDWNSTSKAYRAYLEYFIYTVITTARVVMYAEPTWREHFGRKFSTEGGTEDDAPTKL